MDRWTDKCKFEIGWMDGWISVSLRVFVVNRMYGWMEGWMDG